MSTRTEIIALLERLGFDVTVSTDALRFQVVPFELEPTLGYVATQFPDIEDRIVGTLRPHADHATVEIQLAGR